MIISIEFTDKEIRSFLKKKGYKIATTSWTETCQETDEFEAGTYKREVEVALKPNEKIKKEIHKISVCGQGTPFYPQEYKDVFKKLISVKYKKLLLDI